MKICFITSIQALLKYCSLIDRERSCEHLKNLLIGENLEGNGSFEPVDTTSHPIMIKNLLLIIKSNHQISNMFIETSQTLDKTPKLKVLSHNH